MNYKARHYAAMEAPTGFEAPLNHFMIGLLEYALLHHSRYESHIGDDGVLGDGWLQILRGVRTLLNGELGRFDGGMLDGDLCRMARNAGFTDEEF